MNVRYGTRANNKIKLGIYKEKTVSGNKYLPFLTLYLLACINIVVLFVCVCVLIDMCVRTPEIATEHLPQSLLHVIFFFKSESLRETQAYSFS